MSDVIWVAIITGSVTIANGLLAKRWKRGDELKQVRSDIGQLFMQVTRIALGMDIALKNDQVIFDALRKNDINGESEQQDKIMEEYFRQCTINSFMPKGDKK